MDRLSLLHQRLWRLSRGEIVSRLPPPPCSPLFPTTLTWALGWLLLALVPGPLLLPWNNTTYAGTFKGSEFVPILSPRKPGTTFSSSGGALKAVPVLGIDVENYAGVPLINGTWRLGECNGTIVPSSIATSTSTASGSLRGDFLAFLVVLIPAILIGILIGHLLMNKCRYGK